MTDINEVYKMSVWKSDSLITHMIMMLSVVENRITLEIGKPHEIIQIVGLGYNRGYIMRRSGTSRAIDTRIETHDQLNRIVTEIVSSDRFSNVTIIPRLGATRTIFRHQITFDGTNSIDRRRFAEWGAPFSCCDRLDGNRNGEA